MQKDRLAAEAYSYHPLYEIQSRSAVKQGLIDHILVFENYPVQQEIQMLNKQEHASDLFRFIISLSQMKPTTAFILWWRQGKKFISK